MNADIQLAQNQQIKINTSIWSRLLAISLSLPVICSIYSYMNWYQPGTFSCSSLKSPLSFEQYLVDLHEIDASRRHVFARYGFMNQSDKPITIQKIKPSCGCLKVRLAEKEFKPGETGEFFLQIDPTNEEPGPKEFSATVTYECGEVHNTTVLCRAVMPMNKLAVQPKALIFFLFGDEPTTQPLKITDYRRQGFNITGIKTQHDFVRPVPASLKKDSRGVPEQEIFVTVTEKVPMGKFQSIITIQTDDKEYPEIKIPMLIQRMPANTLISKESNSSSKTEVVTKLDTAVPQTEQK